MQQLYAKIKKSSKYYGQNQMAKREGVFPFPVTIINNNDPDCYFVQGGPGGQYRFTDVHLYVVENGNEFRIS